MSNLAVVYLCHHVPATVLTLRKKKQNMSLLFAESHKRSVKKKTIEAINKLKDVVCFLLSCRKYFCKYVESIKYLPNSASFDDGDKKTIMYRGNLC